MAKQDENRVIYESTEGTKYFIGSDREDRELKVGDIISNLPKKELIDNEKYDIFKVIEIRTDCLILELLSEGTYYIKNGESGYYHFAFDCRLPWNVLERKVNYFKDGQVVKNETGSVSVYLYNTLGLYGKLEMRDNITDFWACYEVVEHLGMILVTASCEKNLDEFLGVYRKYIVSQKNVEVARRKNQDGLRIKEGKTRLVTVTTAKGRQLHYKSDHDITSDCAMDYLYTLKLGGYDGLESGKKGENIVDYLNLKVVQTPVDGRLDFVRSLPWFSWGHLLSTEKESL